MVLNVHRNQIPMKTEGPDMVPTEEDCGSNKASKHARNHQARPPRVKEEEEFGLDSKRF